MSKRRFYHGILPKVIVLTGIIIFIIIIGSLLYYTEKKSKNFSSTDIDDDKDTAESHIGPAIDFSRLESTGWVKIYNPKKAFNGYSLAFIRERVPILIDMNGVIVHAWPHIRVKARMLLTKEGHLIHIGADNAIREVDWSGNQIWEFHNPNEEDFPHHDLILLKNGNFLTLYRELKENTDYFMEINRQKKIVWKWKSIKYIKRYFKDKITNPSDPTHINSVQELPMNKWYRQGDQRFKPGNLLVSARNLNTIFIIEKDTGDVVWQYSNNLDYQHEALMAGEDSPRAGRILVFNNGYNNYLEYRRSTIQEIDPINGAITWEYKSKHFFSETHGVEQGLPNGNILISSTRGGRVFEIDPLGNIVWQWIPPYLPMRVRRYAYDYCSAFKKLDTPLEKQIFPDEGENYIDKSLCCFALRVRTKSIKHNGKEKRYLNWQSLGGDKVCRRLMIPAGASLNLGYGLNVEKLSSKKVKKMVFQLIVTMKPKDSKKEVVLLDELMGIKDKKTWRTKKIPMDKYANQILNLCLAVNKVEGPEDLDFQRFVLLENPSLYLGYNSIKEGRYIRQFFNTDKEDRKARLRELKTMGYIE